MLARYGVMVKVRQATLNPKRTTEGRSMLLEGGAPEWESMESVFVMGTDYSREMRADRVTPKKHRKAVQARGRDSSQDEVTGHGLRL